MRIVIDGSISGFGNNGGTLTNFKSAEALASLGHDVYCLASNNKFDWFKLKKANYVTARPPKADLTIATGWRSTGPVMQSDSKIKLWWVRGWETWSAPEHKWLDLLKRFPNILANSSSLASRIKKNTGRGCTVVFPGIDRDLFYPVGRSSEFAVGALYSPSKNTKQMELTRRIVQTLKGLGIKTYTFGTKKAVGFKSKHIVSPSIQEKREMYNKCSVWIAVSKSEGLHIPPIEAGLCGCALVATNKPYGGTSDYALNGETAMVVDHKEEAFVDAILSLKEDENRRMELASKLYKRLAEHIGSRSDNMKKLLKIAKGMK